MTAESDRLLDPRAASDRKPELIRVLGVDLASGCWGDNGTSQIVFDRDRFVFTEIIAPAIAWPENVALTPSCLAKSIDDYARANGINTSQDTFWLISAEDAFKTVNRSHFEEHCTPAALARRRDRLMSRLARRYRAQCGLDPSPQLGEQWFAQSTAHLLDQRGLFERLRREYFFINSFPENDARFDVTFEQCWPDGMELRID